MESQQDKFRELVKKSASGAPSEKLAAIGNLSPGKDDEHFVLTLFNGSSIELPIAAVENHGELGGSFGQRLVQLQLDSTGLPTEAASLLRGSQPPVQKHPSADGTGWEDPGPKTLTGTTWAYRDHKLEWVDGLHGANAPASDYPANPGAVPFVLGGSHHVSPQTLAAMQAATPLQSTHTNPNSDVKTPRQDGTYPGPHGWHSDF